MTIVQMAIIGLVFHWALRIPREPVAIRDRSRCNSR
jgi:hypothetical protein